MAYVSNLPIVTGLIAGCISDSHTCQILQLTDILLGAVAFRLNGHREALGTSPAQATLSDRVLSLANVWDVTRDTTVRGRFTIWHRRLR